MSAPDYDLEAIDLLQQLIRNACVNDGTVESGHEVRSVDLLEQYLGSTGLDVERFEPQPGRASLVARIEGTDPTAPTLLLMGHTDVVPVNPDGWSRDPFSGDFEDGVVWGRGAIDMLNITASQAVAFRRLADSGFRPAARWPTSPSPTRRRSAPGVRTGSSTTNGTSWRPTTCSPSRAGSSCRRPAGPRLPVHGRRERHVLDEAPRARHARTRLAAVPHRQRVGEGGRGGAADRPSTARRRRSARCGAGTWRPWTTRPRSATRSSIPTRSATLCASCRSGIGRLAHSCTHTTFAPTVAHGGTKTNVIPDHVELEVDIRTLPGQTGDEARAMLLDALGDLADYVDIESNDDGSTASPIDTPLWDALVARHARAGEGLGARAVPHGRRHRQPVLPSSRLRRLRVRVVLASDSRTRTSRRCSTATTSGSTPSRSV